MNPASDNHQKGMTLVELVLALLLLNLIILTGLSMEIGVRRLFSSSDREAQLLSEIAPVVTRVTRDISRAIGAPGDPPYQYGRLNCGMIGAGWVALNISSDYVVCFRRDTNNNALADVGDLWIAYLWRNSSAWPNNGELVYYSNLTDPNQNVTLTNRMWNFSVSAPNANGVATVFMSARYNVSPTGQVNATNPQVNLSVAAQYKSYLQ